MSEAGNLAAISLLTVKTMWDVQHLTNLGRNASYRAALLFNFLIT
jgi:hypothetical protein